MPLLNQRFQPSEIITLYIITLLIAASIPWMIPRLLKEYEKGKNSHPGSVTPDSAFNPTKARPSYIDNLREGYRYVLQSPYLRWMAVATLLLTILLTLINYQALAILQNQLKTTTAISNFTSLLTSAASL